MTSSKEPSVRIKGNIFARPDYFQTRVDTGVTRTITGTRICTLTSDFLVGFRDSLIYECGKSYVQVMKSTGRRWGSQFMQRLDRELSAVYQTPLAELNVAILFTCLADAFNYHGYGLLQVDWSERESKILLVEVRNSVMPDLVKESDRPVDMLMAGFLASVFSHCLRQELDCIQSDCPTLGADRSRFILTEPSRIREAETWIAASERRPGHDLILKHIKMQGPTESHPAASVDINEEVHS